MNAQFYFAFYSSISMLQRLYVLHRLLSRAYPDSGTDTSSSLFQKQLRMGAIISVLPFHMQYLWVQQLTHYPSLSSLQCLKHKNCILLVWVKPNCAKNTFSTTRRVCEVRKKRFSERFEANFRLQSFQFTFLSFLTSSCLCELNKIMLHLQNTPILLLYNFVEWFLAYFSNMSSSQNNTRYERRVDLIFF